MSGRAGRKKGADFERLTARTLSQSTGLSFKRGLGQTRQGGEEVADVECEVEAINSKIHIECKHQKSCSIKGAMKQALGDKASHQLAIVITKDNRKKPLVTMELDGFLELFNTWIEDELSR